MRSLTSQRQSQLSRNSRIHCQGLTAGYFKESTSTWRTVIYLIMTANQETGRSRLDKAIAFSEMKKRV